MKRPVVKRIDLIKALANAVSMLEAVGFSDGSDDAYRRMWNRHLRAIKATLKAAKPKDKR